MIYLILGRTGSGKDYLAKRLVKEGLIAVKSYATRPKRDENEDTHIFITPEEAETFTDKVATTNINGYEYFATAQQVNESNIYIIDPNGLKELTKNMPDTNFQVIYVHADYMDRRLHAVSRATDKIKEEQIFEKRNADEDEQFSQFENDLKNPSETLPPNVTAIYRYDNDYNEATANDAVQFYMYQYELHNRMRPIIDECIELGILKIDVDDDSKVQVALADGSFITVPIDCYVDIIIDSDLLGDIMKNYVALSDKFAIQKCE